MARKPIKCYLNVAEKQIVMKNKQKPYKKLVEPRLLSYKKLRLIAKWLPGNKVINIWLLFTVSNKS